MVPTATPLATLDDLMQVDGKAELLDGRIIREMPAGLLHSRVARRITRSVEDHAMTIGVGEAFGDNLTYVLWRAGPTARAVSPDASYYVGPEPDDLFKPIEGPPTFAAEVRSPDDYGPKKDEAYAAKRKDYFFAGTQVVWDVDPVAKAVTVYRADDPLNGVTLRPGDTADAEPAVPGWRVAVADLFV